MLFNSMLAAAAGLMLAAFYANKVLSIKVTDSRVEELSSAIRQQTAGVVMLLLTLS